MLSRRTGSRHVCGIALVEFQVVAILGLLPLLLGMLQMLLLLMAGHVLQYATFEAARAGAVSGAEPAAMRRALAVGLLPLHAVTATEVDARNVVATTAAAYARSAVDAALYADLEILSPTAAAFEDFAVQGPSGRVVRNDALEHRSVTAGARSGQSIQQVNLLRIRARYCHPLLVPLVDRLLIGTLRLLSTDPAAQFCYGANRVPLTAEAMVNMQSELRFHGS